MEMRELAILHGVHRITLTRWMRAAEQAVLAETRRLLLERLEVSATSCDTLLALAQSQLAVTMHSLFATAAMQEGCPPSNGARLEGVERSMSSSRSPMSEGLNKERAG
jgi:hypothetical protein